MCAPPGKIAATRPEVRHEQRIADKRHVVYPIGHARRRVAGRRQHLEGLVTQLNLVTIHEQRIELDGGLLTVVAAQVVAPYFVDTFADAGSRLGEFRFQIARGTQMVRMYMRFEDPGYLVTVHFGERRNVVGGLRTAGGTFGIVIQDGVDDGGPACRGICDEIAVAAGVGVEKRMYGHRHASAPDVDTGQCTPGRIEIVLKHPYAGHTILGFFFMIGVISGRN